MTPTGRSREPRTAPPGRTSGPRRRDAFFFTLDAMLAATIIATALLLLLSYPPRDQENRELQTTAHDVITILNTARVDELPNPYTAAVLATNFTTANDTVLRAIGVLWATNDPLAANYTAAVLATIDLPVDYGVFAEGDYLAGNATRTQQGAARVAVARQQVSGIASGRPIEGTTATGFLRRIQNRSTASYAYFGGFVGQGNVSVVIDLPGDVTADRITAVRLELDTPANFTLVINGVSCGLFQPQNALTLVPESYDINGTCTAAFVPGNNTVELRFPGTVNTAFAVGGFLRVRYLTDETPRTIDQSPTVKRLPGINGIINLYDSYFVPGNVTSLELRLSYTITRSNTTQNNTLFVTIANRTVFTDNTTNGTNSTTIIFTYPDPFITGTVLGNTTVPIRIGFENLSFESVAVGAADIVAVTDVSGSMDWRMNVDNTAGTPRTCTDPLLNTSTTQRLSVARCLGKQFVTDILNITGNRAGLVAFSASTATALTQNLTTNITPLNTTLDAYVPGGGTCICCGINSAVAVINSSVRRTVLVANGSTWRWNTSILTSTLPPNDLLGNPWYAIAYGDEVTWSANASVFGARNNGTWPPTRTTLPGGTQLGLAIPETGAEAATFPVEFGTALNTTGNTFGWSGANDGWDWANGTYGFPTPASAIGLNGTSGGWLRIAFNSSPSSRNNCPSFQCGGAYGVTLNVTPALWNALASGGSVANLTVTTRWTPNTGGGWSGNNRLWIKARLTNASGTATWLGTELSSNNGDTTPELDFDSNAQTGFTATYTVDLTSLITAPGTYYLELGGRLSAGSNAGWGQLEFDNLHLTLTAVNDTYFFRTNFTVTDINDVTQGFLNVLADDTVTVYLNGQVVFDQQNTTAQGIATSTLVQTTAGGRVSPYMYRAIPVPQSAFRTGTNTLAARVRNTQGQMRFDANLLGINTSRTLAIIALTDGDPTQTCAAQNTGSDESDAILASCMAREQWGMRVYTVGLGPGSSVINRTMNNSAVCAGGQFIASANASVLSDFYRSVSNQVILTSLVSQSVIVAGAGFTPSILHPNSSLTIVHDSQPIELLGNEIPLTVQSPNLGGCSASVTLPTNARMLGARLASYSGNSWSRALTVNGQEVYNLSRYQTPFSFLGDPFIIDIPGYALSPGTNALALAVGDSPTDVKPCSQNNSLVTDLAVTLTPSYTPVLEEAEGCLWTIEHDTGSTQDVPVPKDYAGAKTCTYTNTSITYATTDAYDVAVLALLRDLDFDRDGRVFVTLAADDIEIIVNTVSDVPYLWGPSQIEVRTWR